eukprot:CAMPEP_0113657474 /NCGR_PEP_ID=MMETSP0017_2-20120614/31071_1 /TAXON_ID=2856 /ORGANISM="Cylindrotheca closterium" /LENGTH=686 /DNA_ID=CAMNT_0000571415 /DNA_START=169 /DNA_END=2226 /DNA_ORIENTATION=- /assembly_acc=CAM_ASM_000147
MYKPMLTLALLLFSAQKQAQALSEPLAINVNDEVEFDSSSSQTHLAAVTGTGTVEQLQLQPQSKWSNRTIGENNRLYSFIAPAKDEVEASRFLLETPIQLVTEVGNGPASCHPITQNANSFVDLEDIVPSLIDYTDGDQLPIEILDQNHQEVTFRIFQDWVDGDIGALSVFYRPDGNDGACETYANVTKGAWSQDFTAKCYFSKAEVKLYMRWCGRDQESVCEENCDLCHTPDNGDLNQYMELSFEIDCDPRCSRPNTSENNDFDPFDLPCEDEDTEQLDGFLGGGATECNDALVNVDEDNLPIRVVERSRDGETVVFELTQDYYEGTIVKWGVHHRANATFQDCDVEHNVAYNETRQFTTQCWYGQAAVTLYVYLCELEPHDDCDVCTAPDESLDNFMQYAYNIACYRPCDNDTDIIPFEDAPTEPPAVPPTDPPGVEENPDVDPELPGPPSDCNKLVTTVGNGGSTCTIDGNYQTLISDVDAMAAIDIVSTTNDTVEFKVSQRFVQGEVFRFSVLYDNGISQHDCNTFMDVVPTWEGTFTAVCFENKAAVKFYFRFCDNNVDQECNFCQTPDSLDDYLELTVELDCSQTCDPVYLAENPPLETGDGDLDGILPDGDTLREAGPTEPAPTPTGQSAPAPTGPTDPAPAVPAPTGPAPTAPTPTGPAPTGPTPTGPTDPAPAVPAP